MNKDTVVTFELVKDDKPDEGTLSSKQPSILELLRERAFFQIPALYEDEDDEDTRQE